MTEQFLKRREGTSKARNLLNNDFDIAYVRIKLAQDGFNDDEIDEIIASASSKPVVNNNQAKFSPMENPQRNAGRNQFAIGLIIMVIGCAVTFFSYLLARNGEFGGTYIIASGAIVFGIVRIFQGLSNKSF